MGHPCFRSLGAAALVGVLAAALTAPIRAQRPTLSDNVKNYVRVDAPVIALTNARVIDGTGAPARDRQTLLILSLIHI